MRGLAGESGLGDPAEGSPLEGSPLKGAGGADAAEETGPRRARCGDPEAAPFLTWANRCPSLTSSGRAGGLGIPRPSAASPLGSRSPPPPTGCLSPPSTFLGPSPFLPP